MKKFLQGAAMFALLATCNLQLSTANAQGTAFTYQGRLNVSGSPANGNYDLAFFVASAATGNNAVSSIITNTATPVSNGLFTVTLDFGPGVFTGAERWLAIGVRTNGGVALTALTPRQPLTATPYAVTASNLSGTISAAQVSGILTATQLPTGLVTNGSTGVQLAGTFSGSGTGLTNLNASNLAGGTVPLAQLSGLTSNQLDALTWFQATNRNGGRAMLASNVLAGIQITNVFITNGIFAGDGAGLTNLNVAQLNGVLPLSNLPGNLLTNGSTGVQLAGTFAGSGSGLTNLNASNLAGGIVPDARLSVNVSLLGANIDSSEIVNGTIVNADIATGAAIDDAKLATINTAGKVANSSTTATSANTANSIVARDAAGNFSAGTISGSFAGNGAGLTNISLLTVAPATTLVLSTNVGTFGFSIASGPLVGDGPVAIIAVDVNADGKMDLVTANNYADTLSVLTNTGSGSFVLATSANVGMEPVALASADVNGDGKMDLISANDFNESLSVLTNTGTSEFKVAATLKFELGSYVAVTAADANRDGKMDLIALQNYNSTDGCVATNNGAGGFAVASNPDIRTSSDRIVAADLNGDSIADFITTSSTTYSGIDVFLGYGNGTYAARQSFGTGNYPAAVTVADVNGDGKPDAITANITTDTLSVLTNNGAGSFGLNATYVVGSDPRWVTPADFNGDGWVDLASANTNANTLTVLTNNGAGSFAISHTLAVGTWPKAVVAADFNGDSSMDLASANFASDSVTVLFNGLASSTVTASFQGAFNSSTLNVNGNATVNGFGIVAQTSATVTNNATLTPASGYLKLTASSAVTLNTTTAIANGPAIGAMLILEGTSDVNTITVPHAANTRLSSAHTLGIRDMLTLIWNGNNWLETSYADND